MSEGEFLNVLSEELARIRKVCFLNFCANIVASVMPYIVF